ncbi:MAG: TIGR04076 family protein [Desulfomonile tiedjei]|nr:TIGR04076 family protein [Desulfomonile tiedjei]
MNNEVWNFVQKHLGYSDEEMERFKSDPRNAHVVMKAPELMSKTIVAEVVESHGCNSQHKVGDSFCLDGAGNLISSLCPKRMCIYAVSALKHAVFTANELMYAGVDPNEMRFKRTGCFDVGLECGGWGRVVMEVRIEDRKE